MLSILVFITLARGPIYGVNYTSPANRTGAPTLVRYRRTPEWPSSSIRSAICTIVAAGFQRVAPAAFIDVGEHLAVGIGVAGLGPVGHVGAHAVRAADVRPLPDEQHDHAGTEQVPISFNTPTRQYRMKKGVPKVSPALRTPREIMGRMVATFASMAAALRPSPMQT